MAYYLRNQVDVGDHGAPPLQSPDRDILLWCEQRGRMLITNDRTSMSQHIAEHLAARHERWGVLWVYERASKGER